MIPNLSQTLVNSKLDKSYQEAPKQKSECDRGSLIHSDTQIKNEDIKLEFRIASITQKVLEKISDSQKCVCSVSTTNLDSDTR
jgi:hypothetical protein